MKSWQFSVLTLGLALLSVVTLRWMPSAISASMESEWLAVVIFGFVVIPGTITVIVISITVSLIYGVWKLGNRGNS